MSNAIEVRNLTKQYGEVTAVKDVSFTLEENKICGLLGRNGAGKTTIMHMLTAQQFATSGEIRIFGETPYENRRVLDRMCFIKESQKYPVMFTIEKVLDVAGMIFPSWDRAYAYRLVEEFRLPLNRRMQKLSRGMLSSVGIAVGLASRSPLTVFDEPYLGLDAVARSLFYDRLLEDYAAHPRTIVLSTHLIDEVSRMLEHVLLIDGGRLLLDEDTEQLQGRAYTVAGAASKVSSFIDGKNVLANEAFGGLSKVSVLGDLQEDGRRQAAALGLEIAPVSLQQLIIHLTGGHRSDHKGAAL